ncbi:hypothetical protein VN97_g12872 [Penicillium thymicola]|uniref:Uncharacterized protein n=1 Tax=Penicillium thymicola TaxID=293382 RepID=A0AAI9T5G7_PENTH|nr:hypothetical protein VN97_g12872 [Penicillium thymicola]
MPKMLIPSSAAAFAPRTPPIVVLSAQTPWLITILKQLSRPRLCLNSIAKQAGRLVEILSPDNAVWTLCSVMSANVTVPGLQCRLNVPIIYIKAYVVYVDMVWRNEVAFKLTPETIDALVDLHKKLQSADSAAYTLGWRGKQAQLDKLQEEFVQAANTFMYRTNATALVGLKKDGTGELPYDSSKVAKAAIVHLCVPSMPSPRMAELLSPVLPLPGVAKPWMPEPVYSSEFVKSWSTQSTIPTSSTSNHYYPTLGDTLDIGPTRYFSIDFASSQLPIPIPYPESATYLPSHLPMYP